MSPTSPEGPHSVGSNSVPEQESLTRTLAASLEELRAANAELRERNARLEARIAEVEDSNIDWEMLLASADIVMVLLDREGKLRRYTPRAQKLFRLETDDMGRPFIELQQGFGNEKVMGDVQRVMETGEAMEREMHTDDGRWFLSRLSPYHAIQGVHNGVVIAFVDITRSKEVELAQRRYEERMRLIVESAKDYAIFTMDLERRVDSWNSGAEAMCGYTEAEILGQLGDILFTPEDQAKGDPVRETEIAKAEGRAQNERWHMRKDGSRFYGSGLNMALRDEDGTIIGFVKIMRDLTESKRVQDDLHESHERTVEILESISDTFYAVDSNFRFTYVNQKAEERWGRSRDTLLGKHFWSEFPQAVGSESYQMHLRALEEGKPLQYETLSPILGHWIEVSIYPNKSGGLSVYFTDVTERRKVQEALRESEERLRLAVEAGDIGTCDWNYITGEMHWNEARFRIYGREPEDRLMHVSELFPLVHPDDRERLREQFKAGIEGRGEHAEEYRVVWPDGRVRWIRETGRVVERYDGKAVRVLSVLFDVTAQHEAQEVLRRSHEELEARVQERTRELAQALELVRAEVEQRRQAEAARGELVRRVVNTQEEERGRISRELHDNLGQHLTAVMLGLQALEMQIGTITGGKRASETPQLDNLRTLVDGLMKAAHRQAWELRPAELDALGLEAALGQYIRDWSARTDVEIDFQTVNWEVRPAPEIETTLYRVTQEALTNVARHADASLVSIVLEQAGGTASLIVEDNGRGFDTEQTTGRLGVLGMQERLALVGGTLEIESIPDDGTAVIARVPLREE